MPLFSLLAAALLVAPTPALAPAPAPAPAGTEHPEGLARARANLASYVSNDDYPAEAIRNGEQGTVRFRMTVGVDGRVSNCAIVESSGSASLDSTTCRIMTERARFTPATDAQGNPVPDTVTNAIRWILPKDDDPAFTPEVEAAMRALVECTGMRAAPHIENHARSAADIAAEAFADCTAEEERAISLFLSSSTDSPPSKREAMTKGLREGFTAAIEQWRRAPQP